MQRQKCHGVSACSTPPVSQPCAVHARSLTSHSHSQPATLQKHRAGHRYLHAGASGRSPFSHRPSRPRPAGGVAPTSPSATTSNSGFIKSASYSSVTYADCLASDHHRRQRSTCPARDHDISVDSTRRIENTFRDVGLARIIRGWAVHHYIWHHARDLTFVWSCFAFSLGRQPFQFNSA